MGVDYFDDILVKEFNEVVAIFNPDMEDDKRDSQMMPIPWSMIQALNHRGYPYINPKTSELEWYISLTDYSAMAQETLNKIEEYDSEEFKGE